jgi:type VI secretion system ImpM family protein
MPGGAVNSWLFGKLPAHGDFVSRGLSLHQRDALDSWLSNEMAGAIEQFGDDFREFYSMAPPWCFVDQGESAGWAGGAISPSVDSAGRRFPIIVARAALKAEQAQNAARCCVEVIYDAFDQAMTADAMLSAVNKMDLEGDERAMPACWWVEDENHEPVITLAGPQPAGLLVAMLKGEAR